MSVLTATFLSPVSIPFTLSPFQKTLYEYVVFLLQNYTQKNSRLKDNQFKNDLSSYYQIFPLLIFKLLEGDKEIRNKQLRYQS